MTPKIFKFTLIFILFSAFCSLSYAEIPKLINYQGRLTDSQGQPITGTKAVTFRIYDVESGGAALWQETYSSFTFDRGIFNVMLGGITALNLAFDKQYYLSIQVGGDPEMLPRIRLASVGYAFNSVKLDGKPATEFSLANHTHDASNITGALPVANGGTGITTSLIKVGTYVGNGVPGKTVAHGLGATPVIVMIVEDTTNACILYVNGMATYTNAGGIVPMTVDATNLTLNMGDVMGNRNGKTYYFTAIRAN